jgi:HSP20 family molecular chaperone IbpA
MNANQPTQTLPLGELPADLIETASGWRLRLALPGVVEAALDVHVERGTLRITAVRGEDVPEGARVLRRGPGAARLEREFLLPDGVQADGVKAALAAGVLSVEIARPASDRVRVPLQA